MGLLLLARLEDCVDHIHVRVLTLPFLWMVCLLLFLVFLVWNWGTAVGVSVYNKLSALTAWVTLLEMTFSTLDGNDYFEVTSDRWADWNLVINRHRDYMSSVDPYLFLCFFVGAVFVSGFAWVADWRLGVEVVVGETGHLDVAGLALVLRVMLGPSQNLRLLLPLDYSPGS